MAEEMAIPGTHARVMDILSQVVPFNGETRALDIGAGQGALSAKLQAAGLSVSACDVEPEQFAVPGIECRRVQGTGVIPFPDAHFDVAVAVEVVEHITDHYTFFSEVARVLKPRGLVVFTTPNILSLKSRLSFLMTGFFYSFGPLEQFTRDAVGQHVSPFTLNRYAWMLSQHGLEISSVGTDKIQRSSLLYIPLLPLIRLTTLFRFGTRQSAHNQNSTVALLGRKLVVVAAKTRTGDCEPAG